MKGARPDHDGGCDDRLYDGSVEPEQYSPPELFRMFQEVHALQGFLSDATVPVQVLLDDNSQKSNGFSTAQYCGSMNSHREEWGGLPSKAIKSAKSTPV